MSARREKDAPASDVEATARASLPDTLSDRILDRLPRPVIVATPEGTIYWMNRAALDLLGYSASEVVGQPVTRFFAAGEAAFFETDDLADIGMAEATLLSRTDGRIPVMLEGSLVRDAAGQVAAVVGLAQDVASGARASQDRAVRTGTILYRASREIVASLDPEQVCRASHRAAAQLMPAEVFVITLLDKVRQEIEMIYAMDRGERMPTYRIPVDRGLSGHVITSGQAVRVHDVERLNDVDAIHFGEPEFVCSVLAVPLRLGDEVIGMLSAQSYRPYAYGTEDEQVLATLGNQVAIALENARLFKESQRRTRELAGLYDVALATGSVLETGTLLTRLYQQVQLLMGGSSFGVFLYHSEADQFEVLLAMEEGEPVPQVVGMRLSPDEGGLTGWVIRERRSLLIRDMERDPLPTRPRHVKQPARSWLGVPMLARNRLIGALSVQSFQPQAFDGADRRFLESVAGQVALALQNARFFEEITQALDRERRLNEIARTISGALDLSTILQQVVRLAVELIGADMGTIALYEPNLGLPTDFYFYNLPSEIDLEPPREGRGLMWHTFETGESLLLRDYSAHPDALSHWVAADVHSFLSVPIRVGEKLAGGLGLFSTAAQKRFSERDLALVESVGRQAGVAIQNARLFQATRRQLEELTVLHAVATAGAEAIGQDALIERVTKVIGETLYPDNFGVLLLDEAAGVLRMHPSYRSARQIEHITTIPLDRGITGRVAASGRSARVPDVTREPAYLEGDERTRSELCVPLKAGERVIGVVNAESDRLDAFSEEDERLLVTVAGQLATAIEKVRLFEAERRQRQSAETLREATAALTSALELDRVLDNILVHLERVIPYDSSAVLLLQEGRLRVVAGRGFPDAVSASSLKLAADDPLFQELVRTRQPVVLADAQEDARFTPVEGTEYIRGWMGVPLMVRGEVIGYLTLDSRRVGTYGKVEAALAAAFANQAAVAIDNARLFAEAQRRAEALAEALAQQEELDRLKSQFIQNASHELRTPLAIIRGYAEWLDQGELGELRVEQEEPVAIIARRSRMLTKLLDDFTAILAAETRQWKQEPVDVAELARMLLADFQVAVEEADLTLTAEIAPGLPPVLGNRTQLHRVLDNLLGNALKFTPAGGRIELRLWSKDAQVILEVSDTGVGIPPAHRERIFERFYQVDGSASRRYGGTGLGLALVKEIAEAHGGDVTVQSIVGEGSTFRVTLPSRTGQ